MNQAKTNNVHFSSKTNEWYTPKHIFDDLDAEFGFTLDPCCTRQSAKCDKFFTIEDDGLKQDWSDDVVFVNPPYGRQIKHWVRKSFLESQKGSKVVMLIPARTDTSYWHDYIFGKSEVRFMRGRINFEREDGTIGDRAPFPTAIVIFNSESSTKTSE